MKKNLVRKLELVITFFLCAFQIGVNVPRPLTSTFALISFVIIPLLILGQWKRFIYVATRDLIVLLLVGTAIMSVLWSTNPESTLAHCRPLLATTLFGIYLATRYTLKEQMRLIIILFSIFTLINLIVPVIFPSYGIQQDEFGQPAWQGIALAKNELSNLMAASATLFLDIAIYGRKYRKMGLLGTSIAFIVLLLSKGKGSLAIFIGLLPLLPLYKIIRQKYRLRIVLIIPTLFVLGAILTAIAVNAEFIVVDFLGKNMEGTGRTPLWDYLIQRGLEKPWLGYGYGGFWANPNEAIAILQKFPWNGNRGEAGGNSHSIYIEIFLQLGWLGLSLTIMSFLTVFARVVFLLGLTRQIEYLWMCQLLLIIAITGYYESYSGFLAYRNLFWALYVSIACSTALHLKRILKTNNKLVNQQLEKT